jgi:hydrogenase expression/formation protein HypD
MKYVDEFRDPAPARALVAEIGELVKHIDTCRRRPLQIMEVCGGHTHSIFRYGLQRMLPPEVEFVHGPAVPYACCRWAAWTTAWRSPSVRR